MLGILLWGSGYTLEFPDAETLNDEVEEMILAVAEHRMSFDDIVTWIKERLVKLPPDQW